MATYVPDATDTADPVSSRFAGSAAEEFRTLKTRTNRALVVPAAETLPGDIPLIATRAGKVLGFDASGNPIAVAVTGTADPSLRADLAAAGGVALVNGAAEDTAFLTGGSATAYTITPTSAITAYAARQLHWVSFHAVSGANPTLQISGVAAPPNLVRSKGDGTYINIAANDIPVGVFEVVGISATQYEVKGLPAAVAGPANSQLSHRNKIINGAMDVSQRGVTFAAIATSAYSLDRFSVSYVSTAVGTVTQQADAPADNEFQYSLRYAVTTADAAIAAGDFLLISQRVEGYNIRDLIGKTFSLSFWVRSAKTGIHCVAFRNSGFDRSFVVEYTVLAADTWEKKTVSVPGGLITAGTWNWTTGSGLDVTFALACGTTFQTAANAWTVGNFLATANQVNCLDTIGNIFAITGVQLEAGTIATPFEHRPLGAELALCQRYYESGNSRSRIDPFPAGAAGASAYFKITKRATPTMTSVATSGTLATTIVNGLDSVYFDFTAGASGNFGASWTAAAEL